MRRVRVNVFRFVRWMRRLQEDGDCLVWPHGQTVVRVGNKVIRVRALLRSVGILESGPTVPCNRKRCVLHTHGHVRRSL